MFCARRAADYLFTFFFSAMRRDTASRDVPFISAHADHEPGETPGQRAEDPASRTLRRGLQLLEAVTGAGSAGIRVVELCRSCGLERATVHRLLSALVDCGYVAPSGRFAYVAGPKAPGRAPAARPGCDARQLQKVLDQVSSACGDASFAVVRQGRSALCIARQVGTYPFQILAVQVGSVQPLGVGAAGLALLAALPPQQVDEIIQSNAAALGAYGGMTSSRLQILVGATRERGWSVVGNHAAKGALGVGLALHDGEGQAVAAISVPAAMERMPRQRQKLIAGFMREAVATHLPQGLQPLGAQGLAVFQPADFNHLHKVDRLTPSAFAVA